MLVLPKPAGWEAVEWENAEYEAMKGVVDLYGKTWHFWQVDRGDELPLGESQEPLLLPCVRVLMMFCVNNRLSHADGVTDPRKSIGY
jgi:hypothetical protein